MSWAQLLLWSVLLSFASWASILFAINTSESHRAVFECDTSEIMSEIDAGFSSCMILDLEDVLHNFEMVMPVPPVVRETHPSARAVVLESGIETYPDVFLSCVFKIQNKFNSERRITHTSAGLTVSLVCFCPHPIFDLEAKPLWAIGKSHSFSESLGALNLDMSACCFLFCSNGRAKSLELEKGLWRVSFCTTERPANASKTTLMAPGARFNKEVQPTLSLNLNSELSYSEMGNTEFSVTEQLNCVSLLNSK